MTPSSMPARQPWLARSFGRWLAVLLLVALAGCAGLGGPRTITLSEAELADRIERQFPVDRRLLELLDVRVSAPRVRLLPEANRVAAGFDVATVERMFGAALHGRLELDFGLRYDDVQQAIRLSDVRVQRIDFGPASPVLPGGLQRIGGFVAEQLLEGMVVYSPRPEDLQAARRRGLRPGSVGVTPRGIELTLVPL